MSEDLKDVVASLPNKWKNRIILVAVGLLGCVAAFGFSLEKDWRVELKKTDETARSTNDAQDVKIGQLLVITDNLAKALEAHSASNPEEEKRREERAKRMERLLDLLEKQAYNGKKENR